MVAQKLGSIVKDIIENKENPNYIELNNENIKEFILALMIDIPVATLGPDTNFMAILLDAVNEYHIRLVNDSLEYGAHNPEAIKAAIEAHKAMEDQEPANLEIVEPKNQVNE